MAEKAKNRVFLIIGLPRSGTSLTANILSCLGIPMGEVMKPLNPEWCLNGFFEDQEIETALSNLYNCGCKIKIEQGFLTEIKDQSLVDNLRDLVEVRKAKYEIWGVKNILLAWLLPQFKAWCDPYELNLICCTRSFAEVVNSFSKRTGTNKADVIRDQAHQLYVCEEMYKRFQGSKITVVYNDVLENPAENIERIANFCGKPYRQELVKLVDPKQKRF